MTSFLGQKPIPRALLALASSNVNYSRRFVVLFTAHSNISPRAAATTITTSCEPASPRRYSHGSDYLQSTAEQRGIPSPDDPQPLGHVARLSFGGG